MVDCDMVSANRYSAYTQKNKCYLQFAHHKHCDQNFVSSKQAVNRSYLIAKVGSPQLKQLACVEAYYSYIVRSTMSRKNMDIVYSLQQ
jgi:hypothetical protein